MAYSSSEEDLINLLDDTDSEKETFHSLLEDIAQEEEVIAEERSLEDNSLKIGDFVLVRMPGKKSIFYYVAEIINIINNSEYQVKYLKRVDNTNKFKRDSETVYDIVHGDIEKKLPLPIAVGGSERQISLLSFSVDFGLLNVH